MWMARSAPFASASLMVCFTRSGPIERAITSPPCFSFRRRASSSAKLSGSFISKPMSDSLIQFPAIAKGASLAGTCLMQTMIFTGVPCDYKPPARRRRYKNQLLSRPALENERGVRSAEAERVRKRIVDGGFARDVGHVVQVALRIGMKLVDGRGQDLIAQCEDTNACFESASATKQMTGHGFCRADGELLARCALAEEPFHRGRLDNVADGRRGSVGVDVADVVGRKLCVFQRGAHDAERAVTVFDRLRDVVRVTRHSVPDDFRKDRSVALCGVFERFED